MSASPSAEWLITLDREDEQSYLFKHVVTQEVAYESMPFAIRAMLHERTGGYIEETEADARALHVRLADQAICIGWAGYDDVLTLDGASGDSAGYGDTRFDTASIVKTDILAALLLQAQDTTPIFDSRDTESLVVRAIAAEDGMVVLEIPGTAEDAAIVPLTVRVPPQVTQDLKSLTLSSWSF